MSAVRTFQSTFLVSWIGGFVMKQPKPFFRKYTQKWYVTLHGKQVNLGRDEEAAFQN